MKGRVVDATLWCTCPRCYGVRYYTVSEWFDAHRDQSMVLSGEVSIEMVPQTARVSDLAVTYRGVYDEDGALQVLCTTFGETAELAFRRFSWEVWSPPVTLDRVRQ